MFFFMLLVVGFFWMLVVGMEFVVNRGYGFSFDSWSVGAGGSSVLGEFVLSGSILCWRFFSVVLCGFIGESSLKGFVEFELRLEGGGRL